MDRNTKDGAHHEKSVSVSAGIHFGVGKSAGSTKSRNFDSYLTRALSYLTSSSASVLSTILIFWGKVFQCGAHTRMCSVFHTRTCTHHKRKGREIVRKSKISCSQKTLAESTPSIALAGAVIIASICLGIRFLAIAEAGRILLSPTRWVD